MSVEQVSTVERPPDFFGPGWPGPDPVAPAAALGAVAAAGTAAAVSVPFDRPGIGWTITGLVIVVGLGWVARSRQARPGARANEIAWALAAVALLAVGAVRDAGWLFVLCFLASLVAGVFAVVGPRTVLGMIGALLIQPVAVIRALPWATRGLSAVRTRSPGSGRLGVALLISVGLIIVFGPLFAAADKVFADLTDSVIPAVPTIVRSVFLFVTAGAATLGAAYLVLAPPTLDVAKRARRTLQRLELALPLIVLDLLFAVFVVVQLTVLFGGRRHVLDTAGLTYAEYARGGFWQLLVVTLLTLAVVAAASRWAPRTTFVDRVWVRSLLGTLGGLTLVIVASAVYRMSVYMDAYGFTQLRVFVLAVELALGVVFLLVLAAGVRLRGDWLPQAVAATGVAFLLGLAILNPDRFVAERNIDRFEQHKALDVEYLKTLSTDAVPALNRLPEDMRICLLNAAWDRLAESDDWRAWNWGRAEAREALRQKPPRC